MAGSQKSNSKAIVVEQADTPAKPDDYVIVDSLRLVKPYYFDFKAHVKKRWEGRSLLDVFEEEFPMLTREYYLRAHAAGRLRVEQGKGTAAAAASAPYPPDAPLRVGMCVRHFIHRHEPPALAGRVEVLGETSEFVAVSKPAGLPVHVVGQYRKNTVLGVLQAERPDLGPLFPTYRLDKPVSGLLLLARSAAAAGKMRVHLEERTCQKVYVARVQGTLPGLPQQPASLEHEQNHSDADAAADKNGSGSASGAKGEGQAAALLVEEGEQPAAAAAAAAAGDAAAGCTLPEGVHALPGGEGWRVEVPLTWDPKTNCATAVPPSCPDAQLQSQAKRAVTEVRLLWLSPDCKTSVVECRPLTGRTHQIRVHLQYMGYPIANDTQYSGAYGPPLAFRKRMQEPVAVAAAAGGAAPAPAAKLPPAPAAAAEAAPVTQAASPSVVGAVAIKRQKCSHEEGSSDVAAAATSSACNSDDAQAQPDGVVQSAAASTSPDLAAGSSAVGDADKDQMITAFSRRGRPGGSSGQGQQQEQQSQQPPQNGGGAHDAAGNAASWVADDGEEQLPEIITTLYSQERFRVPPDMVEPVCPHCPCLVPRGYPIDLEPLWLHALRYSSTDWHFEAAMPDWAEQQYEAVPWQQRQQQA